MRKSPTQCRAGGIIGRECLECCATGACTIKGKVYRTVVRPALMYGAETWALKKAQETKLEVEDMRMLRWMCGVTKLDKIRNERIRGTTKVGGNHKESTGKKFEVIWARDEKSGTLRRKEGDGNESTGEKEVLSS